MIVSLRFFGDLMHGQTFDNFPSLPALPYLLFYYFFLFLLFLYFSDFNPHPWRRARRPFKYATFVKFSFFLYSVSLAPFGRASYATLRA